MENINNFLKDLNKWKEFGSLSVLGDEDREGCGVDELLDDDVVVYYDWCDDEMSPEDRKEFYDWLDGFYSNLDFGMKKMGYVSVNDNDGSGGGLIYGCVVYRKS